MCYFHFEPLGLKYEMTIMPLEWVLGCDNNFIILKKLDNIKKKKKWGQCGALEGIERKKGKKNLKKGEGFLATKSPFSRCDLKIIFYF